MKEGKKCRSKIAQKSYEKDIKQRRHRLLAQIEEFHLQAQHFLEWDDQETSSDNREDEEVDWMTDDESEVDDGYDVEIEESDADEWNGTGQEATQPEHIPLQLPSTLGQHACIASGKKSLMDQEIELRTGQANDALSQIRAGLGYKSYLFKKNTALQTVTRSKLGPWV